MKNGGQSTSYFYHVAFYRGFHPEARLQAFAMAAHADEHILLLRITEGSQAAFATLYAHYHEKIYALAMHLTRSEVVAEEIVQDVFLKMWQQQQALAAVQDFEAWLFIMARNHIYTWLRVNAQRRQLIALPEDFVSTEPPLADAELRRKDLDALLRAAVQQLSPQQREVYTLSREAQLSREAIATQLGLSPETVKVHLSRAMRAIRAYITTYLPFIPLLVLYVKFFLIFFRSM